MTSDEAVRDWFLCDAVDAGAMSKAERDATFDRWLAQVKAEAAAKALRSLAAGWENGTWTAPASYVSRWVESEADRIEREAGI